MPSVLLGFSASRNGDFGKIDAFHFTMKLVGAFQVRWRRMRRKSSQAAKGPFNGAAKTGKLTLNINKRREEPIA